MQSLPYWSSTIDGLLIRLESSTNGLTSAQASEPARRTARSKPSSPFKEDLVLMIRQFKSPLQMILIVAVLLSGALGEFSNSFIILGIVLLSGLLGFWQERKATHALQALRAMVRINCTVLRDGISKEIAITDVVRGDVILLKAGDIIAGDAILIESRDLHVNESALTGESFPAEKQAGMLPAETSLARRTNCIFQNTNVVSGTAKALVIATGSETEFGKICLTVEQPEPVTAFEEGLLRFGYMIMRVTLMLSLGILLANVYLGKPVTDSVLFALALAVGMAPELLPAIVTITLSAGATRMAARKVIVKRLASIQNLGAVNIFCSDKTGTLTEGIIKVQSIVDGNGAESQIVRTYAYLNAAFESGFSNPLDEAIRGLQNVELEKYKKVDEVPYDFIRKRLSIAVACEGKHLLITKGAINNVLETCTHAAFSDGRTVALGDVRAEISETNTRFAAQGFRTIGVCYKDITGDPVISKEDETGMTFLGFVVLSDSLKTDVAQTIAGLKAGGVQLKVITGDNILVARHVSESIGLRSDNILTGAELKLIAEEALPVRIANVDVFAETEPNQKERIVRAFRKSGNVVGYIGDGINDVSALHAADVGISVDSAVDVAKESADIVLLQKDLKVLHDGIKEGRTTFLNSLKYIFITTSASFGNMFSMAGTSLFLPFLPLLPSQILLLNLLSDIPAMAISSDRVDEESLTRPRRWNPKMIQKFMIVFGIESSVFDFITFGVLILFFRDNAGYFQTGWFVESVITELLVLLIIRTQRPFLKSRPGRLLLYSVIGVALLGITLPFLPYSEVFGFTRLPAYLLAAMIGIAVVYALAVEYTKHFFFRKISY